MRGLTIELREKLQQTFAGAYTIERELGGGGMSRVFVAMDNALGRRVVVKVLPTDMGGVVSVDRFRREIGIAARLQHAHLVPVLSSGEVGGIPYFLMPYIDGESLRSHLERKGELPLSDAVRILREVASALAYAHALGVVHRDIKPDNVLLSSGAAMVTDFGVAKALSESATAGGSGLTSIGVSLGTPAYMAPEQVSADPLVDARADVYAWGTMAYEMLAGQPPFAGRSPQALLAAQVVESPEPITKRRPSVPPALAELVMRSLEKRPADRPQTADELLRLLDTISISGSAHAGTRGRPSSGSTRMARGRAIVFALVALLVVAIGWAVWHARSPAAAPAIQSIAVVPVSAASDSSDYFADGIIETLIAALTKVPGLEVRSSRSSLSLRGRRLSDAQIGELLHVNNVLHVSVRRSPPRMRVIVDLARVSDGTVLWADQQERPLGEVFAAQDSIANHTANALAIHLGASDRARVSSFGTENLEAYDLYLQGRHAMSSFDEPSLHRAIALFDSALTKDPRYSLALSSQAECWVNLSDDWLAPRIGYANAEAAARKAVALDSLNGAAVGMLAVARVTLERDYATALRETERAYKRDSLRATNPFYAAILAYSGQLDSSAVISRRAIALDPINPTLRLVSGWTEFYNGHFDKAIAHYRSALALVPTLPPAWNGLAESTLDDGRPAEALQILDHGTEQIDAHRSTLARTLAALGRGAEAKQVTAALVADAARRYVSGDYIAAAYVALGNTDEALRWLERANDERSQWVLSARSDPRWRPLRGNPRFAALVAKIGGLVAPAR